MNEQSRALPVIVVACLLPLPVAAEGIDGSRPVVCGVTSVAECDREGLCEVGEAHQVDLPTPFSRSAPARRKSGRAGEPAENWLPITRENLGIDVIMRIYVPDLENMKTWKAPKAERVRYPQVRFREKEKGDCRCVRS